LGLNCSERYECAFIIDEKNVVWCFSDAGVQVVLKLMLFKYQVHGNFGLIVFAFCFCIFVVALFLLGKPEFKTLNGVCLGVSRHSSVVRLSLQCFPKDG
jgi:hypothetical protein